MPNGQVADLNLTLLLQEQVLSCQRNVFDQAATTHRPALAYMCRSNNVVIIDVMTRLYTRLAVSVCDIHTPYTLIVVASDCDWDAWLLLLCVNIF